RMWPRCGLPVGRQVQDLSLKYNAVAKVGRGARVHFGKFEHAPTVTREALRDRERRIVRRNLVGRAGAGGGSRGQRRGPRLRADNAIGGQTMRGLPRLRCDGGVRSELSILRDAYDLLPEHDIGTGRSLLDRWMRSEKCRRAWLGSDGRNRDWDRLCARR